MPRQPTQTEQVLLQLARGVLSDREWQVWIMASHLGYSQRAIAQAIGRSKGTVADTLARAERKIEEAQREAHQGSGDPDDGGA